MGKILDVISKEPVATAALALVTATIGLLVAFGVHISDAQKAAIVGWGAAVFALAALVRAQVSPTAKLAKTARDKHGHFVHEGR